MTAFFARVVYLLIDIVDICLLARCICSWIMPGEYNRITGFLYSVTEPIVSPIRKLLYRIESLRYFPIDLSVLAAFIVLAILRNLLSVFF